jgi:hypothetical protein
MQSLKIFLEDPKTSPQKIWREISEKLIATVEMAQAIGVPISRCNHTKGLRDPFFNFIIVKVTHPLGNRRTFIHEDKRILRLMSGFYQRTVIMAKYLSDGLTI